MKSIQITCIIYTDNYLATCKISWELIIFSNLVRALILKSAKYVENKRLREGLKKISEQAGAELGQAQLPTGTWLFFD